MARAGTGSVSVPDFFKLLSNFGRRQLSESLVSRISDVRQHRVVSLTDFLAYQQLLANLPSLYTTIATAMDIKVRTPSPITMRRHHRRLLEEGYNRHVRLTDCAIIVLSGQAGALSKDDFKVASRVLNRRFSRVECDLVFELFDLDNDGFISADDCRYPPPHQPDRSIGALMSSCPAARRIAASSLSCLIQDGAGRDVHPGPAGHCGSRRGLHLRAPTRVQHREGHAGPQAARRAPRA